MPNEHPMPTTRHAVRRDLASRINLALSKFGLESSVSGGKFDELRQGVSEQTGYWADSSSASKPSRLIVHLVAANGGVTASVPTQNANGSFAYANTARRQVGGIIVRVLPVLQVVGKPFKVYSDWEWLLWYCFWPKIAHGSSGQVFDKFNPSKGTFEYMGMIQDYKAAGLVTLNNPDEAVVPADGEPAITYQQATDAIRHLIQVVLPLTPAPSLAADGGKGGGS